MRVIVWGINYAPEFTGIAPHNVALCEFLHARGDDVSMVTSFPYYPTWEKRPEDRGQSLSHRSDQRSAGPSLLAFCPDAVSALKRIFHEGKFRFHLDLARALSSARRCLRARFSSSVARRRGMARRQDQRRAFCFSCAGYATGRRRRAWDAESELVYARACMRSNRSPTGMRRASPALRRAC